jgi:hypothetical protein
VWLSRGDEDLHKLIKDSKGVFQALEDGKCDSIAVENEQISESIVRISTQKSSTMRSRSALARLSIWILTFPNRLGIRRIRHILHILSILSILSILRIDRTKQFRS